MNLINYFIVWKEMWGTPKEFVQNSNITLCSQTISLTTKYLLATYETNNLLLLSEWPNYWQNVSHNYNVAIASNKISVTMVTCLSMSTCSDRPWFHRISAGRARRTRSSSGCSQAGSRQCCGLSPAPGIPWLSGPLRWPALSVRFALKEEQWFVHTLNIAFRNLPPNYDSIVTFGDVPLVEFMDLVFTRMPCESYRRRLRSSLLDLCHVFRAVINSLGVDSTRALWASFCFRFLSSTGLVVTSVSAAVFSISFLTQAHCFQPTYYGVAAVIVSMLSIQAVMWQTLKLLMSRVLFRIAAI